jgi:hypothetical protein
MSWLAPVALLLAFQDPPVRPMVGVEVQPLTVAVGEPFTVRVRVRAAAGTLIRFPAVPDSAGGVEAVDPRAIADNSTRTVFDQTATYRFIAWEPGRRDVPLGDVRWEQARTMHTLPVGRLRVEVTTLLPADTAELVPRAARAPLDPVPAWWRWALGAAGVLAIAWMSRRAWRTRRTAGAAPLDAYADAQAGFAAVDALALVEAGEPGRAVLGYADVMRAYLTRRFPRASDGLITAEYVTALADSALPIRPEEVAEVLEAADAVKFAAAAVDAERVAHVARDARDVVRDVQVAYEARLAAADKGKGPRGRRRKS